MRIKDQSGYLTDRPLSVPTSVMLSLANHRLICPDVGDVREALSHAVGYEVLMADAQFISRTLEPWFIKTFPTIPRDLPETTDEAANDALCERYAIELGPRFMLPGCVALPRNIMKFISTGAEAAVANGVDASTAYSLVSGEVAGLVARLDREGAIIFDPNLCKFCGFKLGSHADPEKTGCEKGCQPDACCYVTEPRTAERSRVNTRKTYWTFYQQLCDATKRQNFNARTPWIISGMIEAAKFEATHVREQPARPTVKGDDGA